MPKWWGRMLADHNDPYSMGSFRRYDKFSLHWNDPYGVPSVIFIEPKYTDDPAHTLRQPNDDHCPTGVTAGQLFLADIYNTVTSNSERWKSTMLIITYDEHGGFFDHVAPPKTFDRSRRSNFSDDRRSRPCLHYFALRDAGLCVFGAGGQHLDIAASGRQIYAGERLFSGRGGLRKALLKLSGKYFERVQPPQLRRPNRLRWTR